MVEHQSGMLSKIKDDDGEVVTTPITAEELAAEACMPLDDEEIVQECADEVKEETASEEPTEPTDTPVVEEEDIAPDINCEDWMSKLSADEIFNSQKGPMPRLHGLRRLARPFILSEESKVNSLTVVPREYVRELSNTNGEGAVMSVHEEVGHHHFPMASVTFNITLKDGRTFSDSADAFYSNCEELALFPTAVASARAEARCLRKVLGIREHAAEEIVEKDAAEELTPDDDSKIKSEQAKLIDKMLKSQDVTLKDLLENVTTREVFSVEELTTGEARKALRILNDLKKKAKRKGKKS